MNKICKRVLSSALALCMCAGTVLLGSGCSTDQQPTVNSTFNYETDMQYIYCSAGTCAALTKTDTGYYYVGDHDILIYIDKESKKATPLCSKPNCLHEDPDICDAYLNLAGTTSGLKIQYYKGSLYFIEQEISKDLTSSKIYLTKMDKDGKNRQRLTNDLKFGICEWMIHRGYFYYATDSSIMRLSMDDLKAEPEVLFKLKENEYFKDDTNTFRWLMAYGDYAYFNVSVYDMEQEVLKGFSYYVIDTNSKKVKEIKDNDGTVCWDTFAGDKLIYYVCDESGKNIKYYSSDLSGDSPQPLTGEMFKTYHNVFDGKYYYHSDSAETPKNGKQQVVQVYDQKGSKVDSFMFSDKTGVAKTCLPQDNEYYITVLQDENGDNALYMADKSQIGSMNGGVLKFTKLCKDRWYVVKNSWPTVDDGEAPKMSDIPEEAVTEAKGETTTAKFDQVKNGAVQKGYKVSDKYDTFNAAGVADGFSVKLSWEGDGGIYSGDFQILNFDSDSSAKKFVDANSLVIAEGRNVAYVGVQEIPQEVYQMVDSIIQGKAVTPIEPKNFGGKMYKFSDNN